jgi:hypothetical protein
MNWRLVWNIVLALVVYVALTYGVLDGLIHWWAMVFSAVPDVVAIGLWFLVTVGYAWLLWRILRKQSRLPR